jgi:hypothetical protein
MSVRLTQYCIGSNSNAVHTAIGASLTSLKLQALAIADDDGTSDRLTAVERELLHHMINTEHDLVVTAFEVLHLMSLLYLLLVHSRSTMLY